MTIHGSIVFAITCTAIPLSNSSASTTTSTFAVSSLDTLASQIICIKGDSTAGGDYFRRVKHSVRPWRIAIDNLYLELGCYRFPVELYKHNSSALINHHTVAFMTKQRLGCCPLWVDSWYLKVAASVAATDATAPAQLFVGPAEQNHHDPAQQWDPSENSTELFFIHVSSSSAAKMCWPGCVCVCLCKGAIAESVKDFV